eukprot:TRINITY_DN105065_c0_g1_i1.p1 TRINITY_DN105065_c0_g1~~TRINITY_DN105065_c0_g1_i1.p1  ORF type:complete len:1472 (-),score=275.07 TRINITY_DN105065_c0_g1_i1:16-4347(-)
MAAAHEAQGECPEVIPSHAALEAALLGEDTLSTLQALSKWTVWQESADAAPGSQNLEEAPLSAPALRNLFTLLATFYANEEWGQAYVCSASILHLVGSSWNSEEVSTISQGLYEALRAAVSSFTAARDHAALSKKEMTNQLMLALVVNNFCGSTMRFLATEQSSSDSSEQGGAARLVDRLLSASAVSQEENSFSLLFSAAVAPGREARGINLQKPSSLESSDQQKMFSTLLFARMQASRAAAELVACTLQEASPSVREARESALLASTSSSDLINALLHASPDLRLHQTLVELLWRGLRRLSPVSCKPSQDNSRSRSRSRSRHKENNAVQQLEECAGTGTCSLLQSLAAKDMLEGRTQVAMQISRRRNEVFGPYPCSFEWGGFSQEQGMATFTAHSITLEADGETLLEIPWALIDLPDLLLPEEDQPLSFALREPSWPVLLNVDIQGASLVSALPTWVATAVGSQDVPLKLSALDKQAADLLPQLRQLLSGCLPDKARSSADTAAAGPKTSHQTPDEVQTEASAEAPAESEQERDNEERQMTSSSEQVSTEAPRTPSNCNSAAVQQASSMPTTPSGVGVCLSDAALIAGEAASLGILDPEQLRQICRQQGVSDHGLRHDLISRLLLQRLSNPDTPRTGSTVMTPSFAPFSSVRKSELRAACGDLGLAKTGTANDLVYRLTAAASKPVKCEKASDRGKTSLTRPGSDTLNPQEPALLRRQSGLPRPTDDGAAVPEASAGDLRASPDVNAPQTPAAASLDANAQAAAARALQQFENMKKRALAKECTTKGLTNSKKQSKLDLISFLVKHTRLTSEANDAPPKIASSAQELHDANLDELAGRSLKELRAECKEQGLLEHGGREAMRNRLAAWRRSGSADRSRSVLRQAAADASKGAATDSSTPHDHQRNQSKSSGVLGAISSTAQKITSIFKKQAHGTLAIGKAAEALPPASVPAPPSDLQGTPTKNDESLPLAPPPPPSSELPIRRAAEAVPPPATLPAPSSHPPDTLAFRAAGPLPTAPRTPPPNPATKNCSSPNSPLAASPALRRLRTKSPDPRALELSPAVQTPISKLCRRIRGKSPDPRGHQIGVVLPSGALPTSPARTAAVKALLSLRMEQLEDECRRRGLSPRNCKHTMACRLAASSLRELGSPAAQSDSTEILSPPPQQTAMQAPSARSKSLPPTSYPTPKKAAASTKSTLSPRSASAGRSPHQAQAESKRLADKGEHLSPHLLRRRRSRSRCSPALQGSPASSGSGRKEYAGKWTAEEDAILLAAGREGVPWESLAERLPRRSAAACSQHFRYVSGQAHPSSPGMMRSSTPQRFPIPQDVASLLCKRPGASPIRNKEIASPPSTPPSRSSTRLGELHTSDKPLLAPLRGEAKRSRGRSLSLTRSPSRPRLSTCNATTKWMLPCRSSGITRPLGAMFYYCARHASEWPRYERRGEDVV